MDMRWFFCSPRSWLAINNKIVNLLRTILSSDAKKKRKKSPQWNRRNRNNYAWSLSMTMTSWLLLNAYDQVIQSVSVCLSDLNATLCLSLSCSPLRSPYLSLSLSLTHRNSEWMNYKYIKLYCARIFIFCVHKFNEQQITRCSIGLFFFYWGELLLTGVIKLLAIFIRCKVECIPIIEMGFSVERWDFLNGLFGCNANACVQAVSFMKQV